MNRKQVLEVLDALDDKHIRESEKAPRRIPLNTHWIGMVAALLAVVLCVGTFLRDAKITADAVALPGEARIMKHPYSEDYEDRADYLAERDKWEAETENRRNLTQSAAVSLIPFFARASAQFLTSQQHENTVWSPVNAFIGLAMLTELTAGESRTEILNLFGAENTDTLRAQVSAVWESVYEDDNNEISTLANSLWLDDGLSYEQQTMDTLAYHYYASVYKGDFGSNKTNKAIGSWLNNNTAGMLKDSANAVALPPETVLALYSTLFFQAKWGDEFKEKNNTENVFHGTNGDKTVTFMNQKLVQMNYYWHDDFGAVAKRLKNGSSMWFILPDEGKTPADVLTECNYAKMMLSSLSEDTWENKKYMKVNLSVPKFNVSSTLNLKDGLIKMGIEKVFDINTADFSAITSDTPVYITAVNQSARVEIDEKGVKAATYIEIPGAGAAMPPEEIIDFVLDRPFIFVIEKNNLPLFTGVVNNP